MYKVHSVKPKVNKKFIKAMGMKKLKESHHKSPSLLLKKSKRKPLLKKRN
jgi:hypothetical protein